MRTLLLCGLIGLAQATTITFQNDSSDAIFIRGLPRSQPCLGPLYGTVPSGKEVSHTCNDPRFYGILGVYPPKIFPQYITLAFRSPQNGPNQTIKVVGCEAIPYRCQLTQTGSSVRLRLSDRSLQPG